MLWSFRIGTIAGTAVRIHVTFLLFLVWIGVVQYQVGGASAARDGILFIVLLFLCVVLHEFGHVIAARRYGVRTPDVTLFPIGGVASLERIPEKPREELVVALAGPAVNVVIALALVLALGAAVDPSDLARLEDPRVNLLVRLAGANIMLVVFNLIPAFPMDGGRVLRALLAMRLGFSRATQLAASIGQGFAFVLGFIGLLTNPLLIFIAIFVYLAASSEAQHVAFREVARGLPTGEAMIVSFEALSPASTLDDAVETMIRTSQKEFPVVDGGGRLRGVLTRDRLVLALRDHGPEAPVLDVMVGDIPTIHHRQPLDEAVRILTSAKAPALGVLDGEGRLVGLLTPENLGEMMLVQSARPDWHFGRRSRT
ncbi:site-2 protease family protein [Chelatococcus sp. SYSU_G07232]|uniref:Zinc metalloprotease n=1 Tax=Chelatococcus albus TaxID=3047466 RepID=A0ABT7AHN8_9HYPH|nr:site-2 protease family protein [Chelatococcus sp. SYSU_G07232]MDJ1158878.1 site-2 protease family protein [Chelatococcus sp. SYSU_G07232]